MEGSSLSILKRYPFTFALGLTVVLCILANFALILIAAMLHWESHTQEEAIFSRAAAFFGRIVGFIPSRFWAYNPADGHSMMPFWYQPLALFQGFILGALLDFIRSQRPKR